MRDNFCTLFDSYYLTRGIAMYESLKKHSDNFHLYIFAFDEQSFKLLNERHLTHATIISLKEFEDEKLLSVKANRTIGEYCWTSTGSTIKYCIDTYALSSCTYLDADLYFFSNPKVLLDEVQNGSTLITEHRYTKKYDQSKSSGKYCVQFMTFHNNEHSMKALNWWIDACIDWCYARAENGKFGDQKYLDDWIDRFENIHELENLGGGVAPWNVQQYSFDKKDERVYGTERKTNQQFKLVFFHFHALKLLEENKVDLSSYALDKKVVDFIYKPYIMHLNQLNSEFKGKLLRKDEISKGKSFLYLVKRVLADKTTIVRFFRKKFFEKNNVYDIENLIA